MVNVSKSALIALMHKKWTLRVELTKKTSHCKSRDFLRKRRLKTAGAELTLATRSKVLVSIAMGHNPKK